MKTAGVSIVGFGTVGTGVAQLLLEEGPRLAEASGCHLVLRHVVDVDLARPRPVTLPDGVLTDDLGRVLADAEVSIAVETVGGTTAAVEIMKRLLAAGKEVVTANKAALAERGPELFDAARAARRSISFEASCAAGVPVIRAIRDGLIANRLTALTGILNGTCNYILTQMSATGQSYKRALADAQAKGYAEADPALDVSGEDSRHKLAILAGLAFGVEVRPGDIYVEGIQGVEPSDLRYGRQLGYVLKLLAIGRLADGALSLRVHPALVPAESPLATVSEANNAVLVTGHAVGDTLYYGLGAGMMPTASAVVADILDAAMGRARTTFEHVAWLAGRRARPVMRPLEDLVTRFYLRFDVEDRPGVLAEIAGILGREGISIASVLQHEPEDPRHVPLVITTHAASEGKMAAAMQDIRGLKTVRGRSVRIRMLADKEAGA